MLKIRLKRVGKKNDPSFRVVLIDSQRGPKSGNITENLGFYDPKKDVRQLKSEEIKSWISKGAQVSDTVHNILVGEKVIEGKKVNVLPKKRPVVKPADAEAVADKEVKKEEPQASAEATPSKPETGLVAEATKPEPEANLNKEGEPDKVEEAEKVE